MKVRPIVFASLLAPLLAASVRADDASSPSVSTVGTASLYVAPDRVDLQFTITTFDADLARAKAASDLAATGTLQFLKTQNVAEALIRADFARSEAIYDQLVENGRVSRGARKGFQVTRGYGVRLEDVSKFAAVVDRLLTDPVISIDAYTFSVNDDRKLRDDARRQAIRAAKEKADLLAGELAMLVGAPREIQEVSVGPIYAANRLSNVASDAGGAGPASEVSPVGQIEVRAEVSVRFEMQPKR